MKNKKKESLKEIKDQLDYEDLIELLSDNFADTLDFLRDYADSFGLFYKFKKDEEPNIDVIFSEYPFKELKSYLICEEWHREHDGVQLKFKFDENSAEWLKKQGYSYIYVPCITHPINKRNMIILILYKGNEEIIHLDDGVLEISKYYDNSKFKNELGKYLKRHCSFYAFAKSIENNMNKLDRAETVRDFANSDYPDLYFMYQFSGISNRYIPVLYSERVVDFCSRVMIERHKITDDEFLFGDLFIWLERSWKISVGCGEKINNPAISGWQNIREYIVAQDKSLVCRTISKILKYIPNKSDCSIYNCASVFKEIGSPYEYINNKHVETVLKFFESYQLKPNYYLDENVQDIFENESYKEMWREEEANYLR